LRPLTTRTSQQEDATLLAIIEENNRNKIEPTWANIADQLGSGRSGKQCRDRYLNHLRIGIKKGKWTEEEECLLMELHEVFGARYVRGNESRCDSAASSPHGLTDAGDAVYFNCSWASMAKLFGTRTDNDIKNKWYSMVRKQRRVSQRLDILAEYNHQNSLLQMQRNAAMFPLTANEVRLTPYVEAKIETTDVEMPQDAVPHSAYLNALGEHE
jgi:Myb-like DNA-binding domain